MQRKYKKLDYETEDLESLTNSELKKIADYSLRKYLLKKSERKNNKIFCPLKKRYYTEDKMQVAHYIDRNVYFLRYNLTNCNLISEQSNSWDSKVPSEGFKSLHHKEYEEWLGEEKVKELKEKAKELTILYKEDYIELIKKFRE